MTRQDVYLFEIKDNVAKVLNNFNHYKLVVVRIRKYLRIEVNKHSFLTILSPSSGAPKTSVHCGTQNLFTVCYQQIKHEQC